MHTCLPRPDPVRPAAGRRRALRAATLTAALTAAAATLLTGCGTAEETARDSEEKSSSAKGFPVTVENCGTRTTYEKPPSRAVTIHQHPAELMLSLGLKDRMAGTAFPDSAVLPKLRQDFEAVPELAKKEPSFETVLNAGPDFVYGGYGSAFAKNEGRSREAFRDAGIDTYLNREYCGKKQVSMQDTYDEIRTIGKIFGVRERPAPSTGSPEVSANACSSPGPWPNNRPC